MSMIYVEEKRCKNKKLIQDNVDRIQQLQEQLKNNSPNEIVPQITK